MQKEEKITPALIEQWKKEHGDVFYTSADGYKAYFRKPNRKELSYAMALQDDPLKMTEVMLRSCFLGGDTIFFENVEYLLGCSALADALIQIKQVEVGKL